MTALAYLRRCALALACVAVGGGTPAADAGAAAADTEASGRFALVIHGGGGVRDRDQMTPELEAAYRGALSQALQAGFEVLSRGGDSVSAVEAAVVVMEDSPLFNAGRGGSFNIEGVIEHDASIMDGRTHNAGAAAIVQNVKNPIKLARRIMEDTPHVMLAANGALRYAREHGLEIEPAHYFWTERKWNSLQRRLQQGTEYGRKPDRRSDAIQPPEDPDDKSLYGTVGAVALDQFGNLAAATSTGGRAGKLPGRVGDSPIIGAGTYANNDTLAASSTGLGENVIRVVVTKLMSDLMEFDGATAEQAMEVATGRVVDMGGGIGLIAVDKDGEIAMRYTGDGMYRGYVREDGERVVLIYDE